jgi:hypothetical protein
MNSMGVNFQMSLIEIIYIYSLIHFKTVEEHIYRLNFGLHHRLALKVTSETRNADSSDAMHIFFAFSMSSLQWMNEFQRHSIN